MSSLIEPDQGIKYPISGRANVGSSENNPMSVYKKGEVLVHINNVYI